MSTIDSSDDATLPREDFSVCGTHWSASDKSSSKRSSSYRDGIGTYGNPFGTEHPGDAKNDGSTSKSILQVLRETGDRLISDICCDSILHEPEETRLLDDKTIYLENEEFSINTMGHRRFTSGKYAHECESVDTQDSYIRRQSLLSSHRPPSPIPVLEVQSKRKTRGSHRSQTAPRQRGETNDTARYSTFTPRVDANGQTQPHFRTFPSNGNLLAMVSDMNDNVSLSSRSTLTKRSKDSIRSRERHSFSTATNTARYNMATNRESLPFPPRNPGRHRGIQR